MANPMPAEIPVALPRVYAERVMAFLTSGLTGNITIHVRQGVVMGAKLEEIVQKSIDRRD